MRINGPGPGPAGPAGGALGPSLVDRIMEAEAAPIEQLRARKSNVVSEKNEYGRLSGMLDALGGITSRMQLPSGFRQMVAESSHPDVLEGLVDGGATPGNYEFEVRGLAQADRFVEAGFEDVDKTPVGFGYMEIERLDGAPVEVTIDPGSTLEDVVGRINSAQAGVRAQIIDTGIGEEPFRLSVVSEKTGEAARIKIDEDTTHLGFKNVKAGKNLDVMFEDVEISRPDNKLHDLIPGLKLDAKRSEPGTRVTVDVKHDIDRTVEGLKEFTSKYNEVAGFVNGQYHLDAETGRAGKLAADGNLRMLMRGLQQQISTPQTGGRYGSLAEVGITTNAKSGELQLDETKLKGALATDYDGVMRLFTKGEGGDGVLARLGDVVKRMKDPVDGPVAGRVKTLDRQIRDQDRQIERKSERLEQRREHLERQFAAMSSRIAGLESQGAVMSARFNAPPPHGGGLDG